MKIIEEIKKLATPVTNRGLHGRVRFHCFAFTSSLSRFITLLPGRNVLRNFLFAYFVVVFLFLLRHVDRCDIVLRPYYFHFATFQKKKFPHPNTRSVSKKNISCLLPIPFVALLASFIVSAMILLFFPYLRFCFKKCAKRSRQIGRAIFPSDLSLFFFASVAAPALAYSVDAAPSIPARYGFIFVSIILYSSLQTNVALDSRQIPDTSI